MKQALHMEIHKSWLTTAKLLMKQPNGSKLIAKSSYQNKQWLAQQSSRCSWEIVVAM
jgi:hypothetical protein